jgi:hypothetical protein
MFRKGEWVKTKSGRLYKVLWVENTSAGTLLWVRRRGWPLLWLLWGREVSFPADQPTLRKSIKNLFASLRTDRDYEIVSCAVANELPQSYKEEVLENLREYMRTGEQFEKVQDSIKNLEISHKEG